MFHFKRTWVFQSLILLLAWTSLKSASIPEKYETIATAKTDGINYRLPGNILPISYEVTIKTFIEAFFFTGSISIEIVPNVNTNSIVLHAWNLHIQQDSVTVSEFTNAYEIERQEYDPQRQFYIITLKQSLIVGRIYILRISEFGGSINNENFGYYRAAYEDEDGEKRWIATTQFEPTGARWAFPCFDEPNLKAIFKFNLVRPKNYTSIANTELEKTIVGADDYDTDIYTTSAKMSTYLIAFAVTDFGRTEILTDGSNTKQSVYARQEAIDKNLAKYALETGIDAMGKLEGYTGIHYDFGKMDQLAIPNRYYIWGAMENWGLITYKEKYLLYDETQSTVRDKQNVLTIIAHEYAHQWFGNLVSPTWWNYIWLNEGFATFFEMYIADKIDPNMHLMDQFVSYIVQYALEYDGTTTTRPMTFDAGSPEEIDSLFDTIAYDKSGSVIRMMNAFLTEAVMKNCLQKYLLYRSYKGATSYDLWTQMQIAIDESIPEEHLNNLPGTLLDIMRPWENQAGYPLLTVTFAPFLSKLIFKQTRFIGENSVENSEEIWPIPINIATKTEPNFLDTKATHWLTEREGTTGLLEYFNPDDWIIVNKQQTGYYRVLYDERNYNNIIDYLNSEEKEHIQFLNRAQLIDDAFVLAKSSLLSYEIAFNLTRHLSTELNYVPLSSFIKALKYLDTQIAYTEEYTLFKKYIISIFEYAYNTLGTDLKNEVDHLHKFLRADIINWLCKYGHSECIASMNAKLTTWQIQPPDAQIPVYCNGIKTFQDWLWLWNRYHVEKLDTARERLLIALGCTEVAEILTEYVSKTIDGTAIFNHKDDRLFALRAVWSRGHVGSQLVFNKTLENLPSLNKIFTYAEISTIFKGVSAYLTTKHHLDQIITIMEANTLLAADDKLNEIVADLKTTVEKNVQSSEKYLPSIKLWLNDNVAIDETTTDPIISTDTSMVTSTVTSTITDPVTDPPYTIPDCTTTPSGSQNLMLSFSAIVLSVIILHI